MLQLTRTSLVCLGLVTGSLSIAGAAPVEHETVVHDTTTTVTIDLNADTVLCSSADYGALFLKILIPELSKLTLLDHQNTGAGAPCVAAGACQPGRLPEDIISASYPTETVDINVKAVRMDLSDVDTQTCETFLVERVDVKIRGFAFKHERSVALGTRPYSDCAVKAAGTGEPKTDGPGSDDEKTADGAGCDAGNGAAGSTVLLLMLGAAVAIRRRRT